MFYHILANFAEKESLEKENMRKKFNKIILIIALLLPALTIVAADKNSEFVVVIDAGHGGNDTGAVDNGIKEKDVNLAVAKRLQEDLQKKIKGIKVILTRNNDTFVTLQGRADIANKNKADLFISIHTNSVDVKNPNRKSVSGASVYALGLHKDKDNLNVAKRENSVIELEKNHGEKYSGFDPSKDESYIIFEMAQKKNLEQSLRFANYAQKQLVNHADRKDRGVKQAGFWVLWATSMPAVLVELDFICNPESAEYLGSSKGEKQMAEALCNAVEQYYNSVKPTKRVSLNSKKKEAKTVAPKRYMAATAPEKKNDKSIETVPTQKKNVESLSSRGELGVVNKSSRTDTPPSINGATNNGRKVATARKRRSASSKIASENRSVETSTIVVKSESDYLAKENDNTSIEKSAQKKVVKETAKERKKRLAEEKKIKEKERKEKEKQRKIEAKAKEKEKKKNQKQREIQKNQVKNNKSNMKIVVNNNGTVVKTNSSNDTPVNSGSSVQIKKRKSLNSKRNK